MKAQKSRFLSGPQRAVFVPPRTALAPCLDEVRVWLKNRRFGGKFEPLLTQHSDCVELENIDFRCLLEACTQIKTAADIRWLVSEFKADSFAQFKTRLAAVDWRANFGDTPFRVKTSSIRSRLYHEAQLTDICTKLLQKLGDKDSTSEPNANTMFVQLIEDRARIWMSLRGAKSKQRAYITETRSQASMRAPLVASILHWAFVQTKSDHLAELNRGAFQVWNPFCGSGVFGFEMCALIEALPHQKLFEHYPWESWPFIPTPTRKHFSDESGSMTAPSIVRSLLLEDIEARQSEAAQMHLTSFSEAICAIPGAARVGDFFESEPWKHRPDPLIVVANPPFGERLKPSVSMQQYFAGIGARLAKIHRKTGLIAAGLMITPSKQTSSALIDALGNDFKPQTQEFRTGGKLIEAVRF